VAQVTIKKVFDVNYYLDQVGADYYLSAAGEPPGIWTGSAAGDLGLSGVVDGGVMQALFHHDIAPDGTPLMTSQRGPRYPGKRSRQQTEEAIDKRIRDELGELAPHMPDQVRKIRLEERAKNKTRTPAYDMTFSAEKSVSLLSRGSGPPRGPPAARTARTTLSGSKAGPAACPPRVGRASRLSLLPANNGANLTNQTKAVADHGNFAISP
jgi:hypothetical protein